MLLNRVLSLPMIALSLKFLCTHSKLRKYVIKVSVFSKKLNNNCKLVQKERVR
jgi:hypothetical protein